MKKYSFLFLILCVLFCASCKDEEIILSKPGESIAPVTDLQHAVSDGNVTLTWDLPAKLPNDIVVPVSVLIKVSIDGQNAGTHVIENAPVSYTHTPYDPSKAYKFTVKVQGAVNTTDPYVSKLRISPGNTLVF